LSAQITKNQQLQLAEQFVCQTNTNIFLTGRAGTGKTTFLKRLTQLTPKRYVVLAPTGVAAINAGGQTIHSFFQLPFGPLAPGSLVKKKEANQKNTFALQLRKSKIELIRSLDLIVIDEISMVRADLLDAIDEVLRHYRKNNRPFGGVQLLMIGDLLQLPPIVKNEEWDLLRAHYQNLFFFSSKALAKSNFVTITLEMVFRQSDNHFIALLNDVRSGTPSEKTLSELNQRFFSDTKPFEDKGYITLTTHNRIADEINQSRLDAIQAPAFGFKAQIKGDFPEHNFPTHEKLELKVGAQVMFVKNDPGPGKQFYNGLIGRVTHIDKRSNAVEVTSEDYEEPINVSPIEWQNIVYELNPESKDITEKVVGTFTQMPLRLAWAVTIHKSQGLTFEKVIVDAAGAFAHGQVYVALSRCRSLEGLVFKTKIPQHAIKSHQNINIWLQSQKEAQPNEEQLSIHSREYVKQLLCELFDFGPMLAKTNYLIQFVRRNASSLQAGLSDTLLATQTLLVNQLDRIGKKFQPQLVHLIEHNETLEGKQALGKRLQQASEYFAQHLDTFHGLLQIKAETDNKALRESMEELLNDVRELIVVKQLCLKQVMTGFNLEAFIKIRALATISQSENTEKDKSDNRIDSDSHKAKSLKQMLLQWRKEEARQQGVDPSSIMPLHAINQIAEDPPNNLKQLQHINGIGKKRIAHYGDALIALVNKWRISENKETEKSVINKSSSESTLSLYQDHPGISLEELATLSNLPVSTIAEHLARAAEKGKVDISKYVEAAKIRLIEEYFKSVDDDKLGPARTVLSNDVSWEDLKLVRAALRHKGFWDDSAEGRTGYTTER
jgi:DNA-directed RNA polymerase specialized sigma24 family protein/energy-coupling factor transporter ATP-binding protein EcfA2